MATKSSKGRALGAWLDENVPGEPLPGEPPNKQLSPLRALLKREGIDAGRFVRWLGPELREYRFKMCVRAQMPAPADERDALRRLRKRIGDLHRALTDLSPLVHAVLQNRVGSEVGLRRMAADLLLLEDCAHAVEIAVAAITADTGPKPATPRNALLKAVIEQLPAAKMGEQKARELAVDILAHCGIDAPMDERTLRRIVRSRGA